MPLSSLFVLVGIVLTGYPLAAALRLSWPERWLASACLGLVGSAAVTWLTGILLPSLRPDLLVWAAAAAGGALALRDFRAGGLRLPRPEREGLWLTALATALCALQYGIVATSGWRDGALYLASHHARDGSIHLAIAAMLRPGSAFSSPWPPPFPSWGDIPLANYHPLGDVLVALVSAHPGQATAYFRLFPPLYSLLLIGTVYWTLKEWGAPRAVRAFGAALTILCGSLGHFVHLFSRSATGDPFWESHFWMSQTFSMLYNPPLALSLGVLMAGLALLSGWRRRPKTTALALGILWGLGFGLKAFMTVLLIPSLALAFVLANSAERRFLGLTLTSVLLGAAAMAASTMSPNGRALHLEPLWPLVNMPWRLGLPPLESWPLSRPAACLGLGLLYVAGNLGLRVAGLPGAWADLRAPRSGPLSQRVAAAAAFLGLALPLFVASEGVIWNTIQFGYYPLALLPLWAAPWLWMKLSRGGARARVVWACLIVVLALPTTVNTLTLTRFGIVIPKSEVAALAAIRDRTKPGSPVLIWPFAVPGRIDLGYAGFSPPVFSDETSYVPALCARPAYFASPISLAVMRIGSAARHDEIVHLFRTATRPEAEAWLKKRGIEAVYRAEPNPR